MHLGSKGLAVHQASENAAGPPPSSQWQKFQGISGMSQQPSLHCDESCTGEGAPPLPTRHDRACPLH